MKKHKGPPQMSHGTSANKSMVCASPVRSSISWNKARASKFQPDMASLGVTSRATKKEWGEVTFQDLLQTSEPAWNALPVSFVVPNFKADFDCAMQD